MLVDTLCKNVTGVCQSAEASPPFVLINWSDNEQYTELWLVCQEGLNCDFLGKRYNLVEITEGKMSENLPAPSPKERRRISLEDTSTVLSWLKDLVRQIQLVWRLFWDPRVPWPIKSLPPAVLAYLVFPLDIMPDVALGLGQLDDLAVVLLGLKLFIELAPPDVVREHLKALGAKVEESEEEKAVEEGVAAENVIDGEFEVEEPADEDSQPLEA
jgi:uncharacterized membrane protein YkvA (DUF1232 family)